MSDSTSTAKDSQSNLLLDSSLLQKSSVSAETGQMTFYTSLLITLAHFGCGVLEWALGHYQVMGANLGFAALSAAFTLALWSRPTSVALIASGAVITVAAMAMFLFVSVGPTVTVVYILAPIPVFRILGLKWGWPMALSFLSLAAFSLFATEAAVDAIPWVIRVNIVIGFLVAIGFGFLFELSRQKSVARLEASLKELRVLHGLISICATCKKVKDGENTWLQLEAVLRQEGFAEFTHGMCNVCLDDAMQELNGK